MKKWISFPWHIIFLPIFYVMHVYNEYFLLISPGIFFTYLFYYLLLSLGLFGISMIFFKNRIKAGVWTALAMSLFFFFGAFHDFAKGLRLPAFWTSYKFLLPAIVILILLLGWQLKKTVNHSRINIFLFLLFSLLLTIEIVIMIFYVFTGHKKEQNLAGHNTAPLTRLDQAGIKNAPDIFFFIFDEYTSSLALKKYFHFDNSGLDSILLKNGFYISRGSQSNYSSTPLSIASTFNMDYFKRDMTAIVPDNTSFYLKGTYTLKKSLLPPLLKTHGYELINFSLCDIEGLPARSTPLFEQYEEKAFYLATFWGRLQRDLSLNSNPEKFAVNTDHIKRNRDNYSNFMQELRKESSQPRFVFGHVLLPHRPAYLDRHGRIRSVTMSDFNDRNHDSLYLEQLMYANTLIDSLAQTANKKRARPLVLIIEGDHGNRYAEWGRHIREKQFMNLNTYYFSDNDYSGLYDNISPVNSFRVVLNKYFRSNLPLLKDSTVLIE